MAKKKTNSRDLQFIYETQPKGNLNVKNEYVNQQGAVFSACIHIINLPDEFTDFWLTTLTAYDNTMLVVDHFKDRSKDYPKLIKDSIRELNIQYDRSYDQTERDDIAQDVSILRGLSQDLQKRGISVRDLHLRLFVYGPNLNTLEKRVNEVIHSISNSGFQGTVFLDENDDEYRSIFLPGNDQKLLRSNREALPMPTPILGLGYGHNQTSLADPRGAYYGYTRTGGLVYWDLFDISPGRFYYNFFLSGDMGSGKSTMLKKIIQDRLIRGDLVRVFDKSGEFRSMVEYYGGKIVQLDGSNGMINMFQVYPIVTNKDSDDVDVQASYRAKLASLTVNYKLLAHGANDYDAKIFTDLCDQYYKANHYFDREQAITDLAPTDYPTITDIMTFIQQKAEKQTDDELRRSYTRIQVNLTPLKTQYGNLFDGPTTIVNVNQTDFVSYDISSLDGYDEDIQNLQLYNAINAVYNDSMRLGRHEKDAYDKHEKTLDDVRHFLIAVDECHNLLNMDKGFVVETFVTLMSEARKFFGGIGLATQRIGRMYPSGSNASNKSTIQAVNNLTQIYGLCQYKFILKHDHTNVGDKDNPGILRKVYSSYLNDADYQEIPYFDKGDGILVTGAENLIMHFQMTEKELSLFRGGA